MLIKYQKYAKYIKCSYSLQAHGCLRSLDSLMVDIVDNGIMMKDMSAIVEKGLLMLLATVFNIVSLLISLFFLTAVTAGISRDLRADLFQKS